jgi:hypothetical protein
VGEHLFDRCGSQSGALVKTLQKALVIGNHARHLGLLEHDFGQPDPVRVAGVLPGQVVPAVPALPVDQGGREGGFGGARAGCWRRVG